MKNKLLQSKGNRPRRGSIRKCRTCGKEFYVMPCQKKGSAKRVSCSLFCWQKYKRIPVEPIATEVWANWRLYDRYFVSNLGRIKDESNRLVPQQVNSRGYCQFRRNKGRNFNVHRLVAELFILNPEGKPQVNHKDGDKTNNKVSNLEWCTPKENVTHAIKNGLRKPQCGQNSTLTRENVVALRQMAKDNPQMSNLEIGKIFGIKQPAVSLILNYKRWANA